MKIQRENKLEEYFFSVVMGEFQVGILVFASHYYV